MTSELPTTMAAAVLTGHGGLDALEYRTDWPVPEPASDEVLIRVGACGVNGNDVNTRTAWYSPEVTSGSTAAGAADGFAEEAELSRASWGEARVEFPRVQGADIVGSVAAVGDGVDEAWIGARVIVDPWLRDWNAPFDRDRVKLIGSERDGGFAQYVAVPERNVHRIEHHWSDELLASFPSSYVTGEHVLQRARVSAGEVVLVTGASGGVGSALVQLAKRRRAIVVAVAGREKTDDLLALGVEAVVPRETKDIAGAVRDATGYDAVDIVADVVGGEAFGDMIELLRRGGRYVCAGAIAGPFVRLDLRRVYLKDLELIGATVPTPEIFGFIVKYVLAEEIKPLVARAFPLSEIREAQRELLARRNVGKIVLVPPQAPPVPATDAD